MKIDRVQRWVMSALLLTVATIFASGLTLSGVLMDESRQGSRLGLLVNAAVVGIAAMAGVRIIHQKSLVTPWLILGLVPALVGGGYVIF